MKRDYPRLPGAAGLPERIDRLRRAYRFPSQTKLAEFLGVHPNRLNNVMRGFPLSRQLEEIICDKFVGVDGGWLRRGEARGLGPLAADKLGEALRGSGGHSTQHEGWHISE